MLFIHSLFSFRRWVMGYGVACQTEGVFSNENIIIVRSGWKKLAWLCPCGEVEEVFLKKRSPWIIFCCVEDEKNKLIHDLKRRLAVYPILSDPTEVFCIYPKSK